MKFAAVYIVKSEFLAELSQELDHKIKIIGDIILSPIQKNVCFAQDIWFEPQIVRFESISQAVNILRQAGKFWYLHPLECVRRSRLIESQLRKLPNIRRNFPIEEDIPPIGCFMLLDQNTLLFSTQRIKQWPMGKCFFIEDKINPPNRAYLKLWEAFTILGKYPKANDVAMDLGASPGGWTYVLQKLGAQVTSVDKALLDPKIAALPHVKFLQQSAFAIEPSQLNTVYDWVLSDVACYPERAYSLILKWINSEKAKQLIFTIKLQGEIDLAVIQKFQSIPNAYITNLFYNKHEVTFFYPFRAS